MVNDIELMIPEFGEKKRPRFGGFSDFLKTSIHILMIYSNAKHN